MLAQGEWQLYSIRRLLGADGRRNHSVNVLRERNRRVLVKIAHHRCTIHLLSCRQFDEGRFGGEGRIPFDGMEVITF